MTPWTRAGILIAALAAVALFVSPTVAVVAALALVGEDLWGWVSGRRNSLTEDVLGPRGR